MTSSLLVISIVETPVYVPVEIATRSTPGDWSAASTAEVTSWNWHVESESGPTVIIADAAEAASRPASATALRSARPFDSENIAFLPEPRSGVLRGTPPGARLRQSE